MKPQRNLDGIYFRVQREGKWCNVCLSDMTTEEREQSLAKYEKDALIRTINILCQTIQELGEAGDFYRE